MKLISHEIPVQLFPFHDTISDYPYVLGHLLGVHGAYTEFYKEKLKEAPYSILDNSAFELDGNALPLEKMYELGEQYKPSHVVIPDVFLNSQQSINNILEYHKKYAHRSSCRFIGVLQGNTVEDYIRMANIILPKVDILGLPHVFSFDKELSPEYHMDMRYKIVRALEQNFGSKIKVHLLGCQTPNEFSRYANSNIIHSVDTSNPIISGWELIAYIPGLGYDLSITSKPKDKLAENLDKKLSPLQLSHIFYNVHIFKRLLGKV